MTKRFIWHNPCKYDESLLKDTETNETLSIEECLNLLNEQDKKIKYLEQFITQGVITAFQLDPEIFEGCEQDD